MNKVLTYKRLAYFLCAFLWTYLFIRAWFNEPLHDEIATYFFYIYQGDYWGDSMVVDANNHLLNSIIGHFIYPFAKEQLFWYRLPSLLSLFLYFYATYQLCKLYKSELVGFLTFVALNSIPFIMEYFAYTRGYGISLGFFMLAFYYFSKYLQNRSIWYLFFCFGGVIIAISANLTFIQTGLMLAVVGLVFILQQKQFNVRTKIGHGLVVLVFISLTVPASMYALFLKDAGALYYGSLDGMWLTTGRSLVRYIFFNDGWFSASIVGVIFGAIILVVLRKIKNQNPFKTIDFQYAVYALLFGNLVAIWILATFLEVNFPEDRTAFGIVLFTLLALGYSFDLLKGKWSNLILIYLYFPIAFVANMTLHTSVFSPDDRMTNSFYKEVKPHINQNTSLMIYSIMRWSWPMHESKVQRKAPMYNSYNVNQVYADVLLTKTNYYRNPKILELYDTIAISPSSRHIAYKRKVPMLRELILEGPVINGSMQGEYFNLLDTNSLPKIANNQPLLLTVKGHLKTFEKQNKVQLVFAIFDADEKLIDYSFYPFEYTFQGQKIDSDFNHHFILESIAKGAKKLKVYFWSRQNDQIEVKNAKCYLYLLKENQNGPR
ncbi:MAG: hypothetical protein KJ941_08740 [Bacteroidetes bacterium]|nr:hypothetical protein [Bacteroidota bacterium]